MLIIFLFACLQILKINWFTSKELLSRAVDRFEWDGLNSLKYKLTQVEKKKTFTRYFIKYSDNNALIWVLF